jgi:hypothetical protein
LTIIGGALCVFVVYFDLTYPTADEIESKQRLLFSTDSASVDNITVEPSRTDNRARLNLVGSAVTITNRKEITELIDALNDAKKFGPGPAGATSPTWPT